MKLETLSDKELQELQSKLQTENAKRAEARREAARVQRNHEHDILVEHIDVLLTFVPEHSRTSCNDANPGNEGRCHRCSLLAIKKHKYVDPDLKLEIYVVNDPI